MTVPVNTITKTVVCDGQTRTWQFNFPIGSQESIEVWVKPPQGAVYQVTDHIVLDRESDEDYTYVTYPSLSSGLSPLASGYKIVLRRVTPLTQDVVFSTKVLPETFTQAFDKATLQIQNLDEKISRCVRFDPDPALTVSDTNASTFMATVLQQASQTIQTAANEVSSSLTTHNASDSAHADIRSAITQAANTLSASLTQEQTLRQSADSALQLNTSNLSGQLSQEVSNRQSADGELQTQITSQGEAISALQTSVAGKQATLSTAQLAAVNSGVTSGTVAQVQTNEDAIAALDNELDANRPWKKPSDWVDIRNGALANSIYYLVAHSAPTESEGTYTVADYAQFSFRAEVSTSGHTYDVYVDGVKVATTATGNTTTLDWGALYTAGTVSTIHTTMHPTSLVCHVVRVTPTTGTDTFTRFRFMAVTGQQEQGALWIHFQIDNAIGLANGFANETTVRNFLLEAITAKDDTLKYKVVSSGANSGIYSAFAYCSSLKHIPTLVADATTYPTGLYIPFRGVSVKKVVIKNNSGQEDLEILNNTLIEEFDIENPIKFGSNTTNNGAAYNVYNLKKLPAISQTEKSTAFFGSRFDSLEDTFIDLSFNDVLTTFRMYGSSAHPTLGLKGLIVSSSAPFDFATAPQINVSYTGLNRAALVALFNSLPTVSAGQVCEITGTTGANDLTAADLAIATAKGWTITR